MKNIFLLRLLKNFSEKLSEKLIDFQTKNKSFSEYYWENSFHQKFSLIQNKQDALKIDLNKQVNFT